MRVPRQREIFAQQGPRPGLEEYPAVYLAHGHVTHLLPPYGSPNNEDQAALCGLWPGKALWHGTGTEDEYDIAREQALCRTCTRVVTLG